MSDVQETALEKLAVDVVTHLFAELQSRFGKQIRKIPDKEWLEGLGEMQEELKGLLTDRFERIARNV